MEGYCIIIAVFGRMRMSDSTIAVNEGEYWDDVSSDVIDLLKETDTALGYAAEMGCEPQTRFPFMSALKLTGGRVALEITDSVGPWYVRRRSDGMLEAYVTDSQGDLIGDPDVIPPSDISKCLCQMDTVVKPVLLADCPFGDYIFDGEKSE